MPQLKVKTDEVKDMSSNAYDDATSRFRVIPEGYYLAVIKSAEWRSTPKADYIDIDADILQPEGNHVWLRKFGIRATTKDDKGNLEMDKNGSQIWILAKYFMIATGVAKYDEGELGFDTDNLAKIRGLVMKVKIKTEKYTRKEDGAERQKNAVSSFFNISEGFAVVDDDNLPLAKISGVTSSEIMAHYLGEAFAADGQVFLNADAYEAYQFDASDPENHAF